MKILFIHLLLFLGATTASFAQGDEKDKLSIYDISEKLENYKAFTIKSDEFLNIGKSGYDINYIMELFNENSANNEGEVIVEDRAQKIIAKTVKKKQYLKYRTSSLKNIMLQEENNSKVTFLGKIFIDSNKIISYFTFNTPQFSGCVYQSISDDGGKTWQSPTIAIKHNKKKLKGWSLIQAQINHRKYGLTLLLTDTDNTLYLSHSYDKGDTWSYPKQLINTLKGVSLHCSVHKDRVTIIFESRVDKGNLKKGNILLWIGKIEDLNKNKLTGILVKIAQQSKQNEKWRTNHITSKDGFVIKTTYNENTTSIEGYLLSLKNILEN